MNETKPRKRRHQSANPYACYSLGQMRVCPICGREFLIPDMGMWAFKKYHTKQNGSTVSFFFCRWSCMREWEKVHRQPKKKDEVYDY